MTVLGLAMAGGAALVLFVIPNWAEFQFYNFQMTVTRKTDYAIGAFKDRVSWLPLAHGVFTRMWLVLLVASVAATGIVARWRTSHPAERLAVLWLMVGLVELVVHDSGNERRYVMFVPALVALASLRLAPGRALGGRTFRSAGPAGSRDPASVRLAPVVTVAVLAYLVVGSALRLIWLDEVLASEYSLTVRVSAGLAVLLAAAMGWRWRTWGAAVTGWRMPLPAVITVVVLTCGTDLTLYAQWARHRTFHNYYASRALGTVLPAGTRVHGKLANGLALENAIVPIFVGRGFGNYADRLERADARYILTYTQPRLGYEGSVILDVLQHYPGQRVIVEFDVDETPGPDRAALIDKFPGGPEPRARYQ